MVGGRPAGIRPGALLFPASGAIGGNTYTKTFPTGEPIGWHAQLPGAVPHPAGIQGAVMVIGLGVLVLVVIGFLVLANRD